MAQDLAGQATVYKLDLTRFFNKIVKKEFNITGLPTYLVYRDGKEVHRLSGDEALDLDAIRSAVDAALAVEPVSETSTP